MINLYKNDDEENDDENSVYMGVRMMGWQMVLEVDNKINNKLIKE